MNVNKMWYVHNGTLFSRKKAYSTNAYYNINEPRKHYAK